MRTPRARIVVAYDFSEPSDAALAEATRMARATNAEVVLLHVLPGRKSPGDWAWKGGDIQRESERARIADALEHEVADLRSLRLVARTRLCTGEAASTILDIAKDENASAIFVGADAHEGFVGTLLGRVALRVVREAAVPVFVVRRRATASPTDGVEGRRVVVGFDFTSASMAAFDAATSLARTLGSEVRVVHVIATSHSMPAEKLAALRTRIEELVSEARRFGVEASGTLAFGDVATALVAETERDRRSVIALGMHPRSTVGRAVHGDVVDGVLRMTDATVLVTHSARVPAVPLVGLPLLERSSP